MTTFQLLGKLIGGLEEILLTSHESLLPVISTIHAISTNAKEITFTDVSRLGTKLTEVASLLPDLLAESSREDVLQLTQRLTDIGLYLLEVLRVLRVLPDAGLNSVIAKVSALVLIVGNELSAQQPHPLAEEH